MYWTFIHCNFTLTLPTLVMSHEPYCYKLIHDNHNIMESGLGMDLALVGDLSIWINTRELTG